MIKYFENRVTVNTALPLVQVNEKDRCSSLTTLLRSDCHIFIDDFHGLTTGVGDRADIIFGKVLSEFESNSRSQRKFWIANDNSQRGYLYDFTKKHKKVEDLISRLNPNVVIQLSDNLRNTYEIAQILTEIRKTRSFNFESLNKGVKFIDQQPGHFIHGPKGSLLFLKSFTLNTELTRIKVKEWILEELEKLKNTDVAIIVNDDRLLASDKGFKRQEPTYTSYIHHVQKSNFYRSDIIDWEELCKDTVKYFSAQKERGKNRIDIIPYENTFSAEWPAIIGILEWTLPNCGMRKFTSESSIEELLAEWYDELLTRMYITASRARVYCSIIIVLRDVDHFVKECTLSNAQRYPTPGFFYTDTLTEIPVLELTKHQIWLILNDVIRIFGSCMPTLVIMRHGSPVPYLHKLPQGSPGYVFADYVDYNKRSCWESVDLNELARNIPNN